MLQISLRFPPALLAFLLLVFSRGASARDVNVLSYGYPYNDPYLATTTIAILKGQNDRRENDRILDLEISLFSDRDDVALLEGKGKLRVRFFQNQGKAPLIVVIPGLGSSAYAGSASYVADVLFAHGFHVLVVPDPLNWNFALAASASGFPGEHVADARDMYRAMQFALKQVIERSQAPIEKIGLMGFSEGALCAAYVDKLDAEKGSIQFYTTLLINPPVDPLAAIRKIDAMARAGLTLSASEREYVQSHAFGTAVRAFQQDYNDPEYFAGWDRRLRMTHPQIQYLIGASLFSEIGDTMYVIEQAKHPGVLKSPLSDDFRSARLEEARSIGLQGYLDRFLLPRLRSKDPRLDADTLNAGTSLKAIGPALAASPRVFLMHNRDDILLSPGDIDYLQTLFGSRATIYPRGGHLGNLWYPPNRQDIVDHFLARRSVASRAPMETLF